MNTQSCPHCGQSFHTWEQPALMPGRSPRLYAECVNPQCAAYMVTLEVGGIGEIDLSKYHQPKEKS